MLKEGDVFPAFGGFVAAVCGGCGDTCHPSWFTTYWCRCGGVVLLAWGKDAEAAATKAEEFIRGRT